VGLSQAVPPVPPLAGHLSCAESGPALSATAWLHASAHASAGWAGAPLPRYQSRVEATK
jgi:hypothetical protein